MARELDPITNLYYVRNRWYDPVAGRFVSEDPIGLEGGINPYAYVGNSPTNMRDPSGLDPTVEECVARLMEERGKGSITWTDERIRNACGDQGGSLVLPPLNVFGTPDPFAQGNATLLTLMARTDAMVAGMSFSLGDPRDVTVDLSDVARPLLQCAADQFGLTALGGAMVVAGAPLVPKRFQSVGASAKTSLASGTLSRAFPQHLPRAVWAPTLNAPWATTRHLGRALGRWTPVAGEVLLVIDGVQIYRCVQRAG